MGNIVINKKLQIEGHADAWHEKRDGLLYVAGVLSYDGEYLGDIHTIELPRCRVLGVDVVREVFGSDTDVITYEFIAESLEAKEGKAK